VFGDPSEHLWTDFFILVEAEHVIAAFGMIQLDMGTTLGYCGPTFSEEGA
jgi:hypothetical protein